MTTATATAIHGEIAYAAAPAIESVRRISSGAYATDDSASEAKTGKAMRLGRSVCCSRSDRNGRPTSSRFSIVVGLGTKSKSTGGQAPPHERPDRAAPDVTGTWHA